MDAQKKPSLSIGFDAKRIFHNNTGLGNYGRDLIRILSDFFPENNYFLYNPKPKKNNQLALKDNIIEVLPDTKFWKFFSSLWRQRAIIRQLKNNSITIYHGLSGEIPRGIEKTSIKTVVTIHDLIFLRYPKLYSALDVKIHKNKFKYACENADKIVAISEQTKKDIIHFFGINPEKITVIYQGCSEIFKRDFTETEKNKLKKSLNLPSQFLLNVGTIEERKNIFPVIKAIKGTKIPLIIVGKKTKYFTKINQYLIENQMEEQVKVLHNISQKELALLYQLATIFIYPSIFEGFGIPIIEALYSKTPVITTKGGCFAEAGGLNSVYVDCFDVQNLSLEINKLFNDIELRTKMGDLGREYVQKFNDDMISKKMIEFYKKL